MRKVLRLSTLGFLLAAAPALGAASPALPAGVHSDVVTSMVAPSRVYAPSELPLAGRNCAEVLDDLRARASFHGEVRSIYPTTDANTCYNVRGQSEQVAVVCCAPVESSRNN